MDEVKIGNKMVKARQYPWGIVQGKWDKQWLELFLSPSSLKVALNAFFEVMLIFYYDSLSEKLAMFNLIKFVETRQSLPITCSGVPRHSEGGTTWSGTLNKIQV